MTIESLPASARHINEISFSFTRADEGILLYSYKEALLSSISCLEKKFHCEGAIRASHRFAVCVILLMVVLSWATSGVATLFISKHLLPRLTTRRSV